MGDEAFRQVHLGGFLPSQRTPFYVNPNAVNALSHFVRSMGHKISQALQSLTLRVLLLYVLLAGRESTRIRSLRSQRQPSPALVEVTHYGQGQDGALDIGSTSTSVPTMLTKVSRSNCSLSSLAPTSTRLVFSTSWNSIGIVRA